jgi:hypothetical protein
VEVLLEGVFASIVVLKNYKDVIWVWNLTCNTDGETSGEAVREQCVEEGVRAQEGRGDGDWRKLHSEVYDLQYSQNIRVIE